MSAQGELNAKIHGRSSLFRYTCFINMHVCSMVAFLHPLHFNFAVIVNRGSPNVKAHRLVDHANAMLGYGNKCSIIQIKHMTEIKAFYDQLLVALGQLDGGITHRTRCRLEPLYRKFKLFKGDFMPRFCPAGILLQSAGQCQQPGSS
ncbi:hypothetical protein D3C77_291430 [compost metagenome]